MGTVAVIFDDIEAVIVAYLTDALKRYGRPVPVRTSIPSGGNAPEAWVKVLVTGGVRRHETIDTATVILEAWAATETDAQDLSALVRAVFPGIADRTGRPAVYGTTELSRPQNLPDPTSGKARYTATSSIRYRGYALPKPA
ncbi:hypothetical protein [Cryobacterium sp. PH31-O1]|uniref:hypothetical protein n=1 Tax=Cryobacterium sp. PH31-O1 TaxID=3046306 RepID=UPI0024B9EE4A|nr:hypothetical protein [Cryobacterium sp. PH31-O1]MDJ0338264.1 hypothetical protein [Cryobacterium sp. PH31-O1]